MKCKHCNQPIIKIQNRWYHLITSKWFCSTKYAEALNRYKRKIERANTRGNIAKEINKEIDK